ncbi:MAG: hypothetical protein ACXWQO_12370, partial [Bdellovibrionota bacterium]
YVRIGPMPMTPVASSKLQCRWLRNFDQRTHTYPTAGLYCAGGPFIWNHQEAGEKFVGDVTKMHLFFPVMGADYLSYGQLNSFQARKIDAEGVTHKEWSYLAGENRYSMVLQALKQSPLQRKNYKFSYRTSYGSSCEVEFENTYQGQ